VNPRARSTTANSLSGTRRRNRRPCDLDENAIARVRARLRYIVGESGVLPVGDALGLKQALQTATHSFGASKRQRRGVCAGQTLASIQEGQDRFLNRASPVRIWPRAQNRGNTWDVLNQNTAEGHPVDDPFSLSTGNFARASITATAATEQWADRRELPLELIQPALQAQQSTHGQRAQELQRLDTALDVARRAVPATRRADPAPQHRTNPPLSRPTLSHRQCHGGKLWSLLTSMLTVDARGSPQRPTHAVRPQGRRPALDLRELLLRDRLSGAGSGRAAV